MAKKLLPPWVCFHTVKHHIKPLLQHPRFLIHMYFAEYFWVLSITESARGCCERASFCINMFVATYRNPLGSPKCIQQAVHQPQTWVQRKTVCHHLSCSRWGLVFFLMPLSGNHVSSHLYFLLLSLPYLILSVCHLRLRTYFTATTDQSDKKWWSVWLPILSWLCEQKRDLLALIMAIVGFGDVKARQKQAGRDVCIVASFSQKCLEPFIHNPQRELYMNEHPVQHKTTKRHVYIHC